MGPDQTKATIRDLLLREGSCGRWTRYYNAFDAFDLIPATSATAGRDPHFQATGTGTVPAPVLLPGGGVLIATRTTSAADDDEAGLFPYSNSAFYDPILPRPNTGKMHLVEMIIVTDATITTAQVYGGLKLTDTGVMATDADQVLLLYDTDNTANFGPAGVGTQTASANWLVVYSIAGDDVAVDTGIPVAASTVYRLTIIIADDGRAYVYVNDKLITYTPALTAAAALKPTMKCASRANAGAVRKFGTRGVRVSRNFA